MDKELKENNLQLEFADFINANAVNTDPVINDVELGLTKKNAKSYVRKTTDEERKAINTANLQPKPLSKVYFQNIETVEDNSKRIITDIRAANQINNYLPKTTARVINGIRIESTNGTDAENYLQLGSQIKDTLTNDEEKANAINICEKWKMTSYKNVIADLAGGLLKQISMGVTFQGITPLFVDNPNTGKKTIVAWLVKLTWAQLKKCAFGGLVDNYGNIKYGYGDILAHTTERDLKRFVTGDDPTPRLLYFDKNFKKFGEFEPITIYDKQNDGIILQLDRRYFPFNFTDKGDPTGIEENSRYLINIAGVASIAEIGHANLLRTYHGNVELPSTNVAIRFYQSLMAAFQFQSLLGISYKNTRTDKENIIVRKEGIYNMLGEIEQPFKNQIEYQNYLFEHRTSVDIEIKNDTAIDFFPKDIKKRQWQNIQTKGRLIGETIINGLRTTGIFEELQHDPKADRILIPSNQTSMQYLQHYENALLAKVEPITKIQ